MTDAVFAGLTGEARMLPALLRVLEQRRNLVEGRTIVARELPWHGRRVDLATLSPRRFLLTAFELKCGGFGRALEQAIYNKLSFDRSWVVVDRMPSTTNSRLALSHGVGIIVVAEAHAWVQVPSRFDRCAPTLRKQVARSVIAHGVVHV